MSYATAIQVSAYVGIDEEDLPSNIENLIARASELLDYHTLNRSKRLATSGSADMKEVLAKAVSAQVQYWLEVGEEIDVTGSPESFSIGPMSINGKLPSLAPRAKHLLFPHGLLSKGIRRT